MKLFLGIVLLASVASAAPKPAELTTAYGYLERSVVEGEKIRQAEEKQLSSPDRIVGGTPATQGSHPYVVRQAMLMLTELTNHTTK